jgi:quinol monooxygenase YgiN
VQFGALSLGSLIWGQVAALAGLPVAHLAAAAGLMATIPLLRRWRLQTGAGIDLTPSMHWPTPEVAIDLPPDRGPVIVSVTYRIDPANRDAFLDALCDLARHRRGDGAFGWGVYEDAADPGRFVEGFYVDSWLEHLRQHERVTEDTRLVQERVNAFHTGDSPPAVTHLIAVER